AETADGELQDLEVGVEWGLLSDGRGHVDGVGRRSAGGGSVGVGYGELFKLGGLRGGGVGDGNDAEVANSGFILKLDAEVLGLLAGAVSVVVEADVPLLDDESFSCVRRGGRGGGGWGGRRFRGLLSVGERGREGGETQKGSEQSGTHW